MLFIESFIVSALLTYTPADIVSAQVLGATSEEVIASFKDCDIQKSGNNEALLCQTRLNNERCAVSFILDANQRVGGIAGLFATENKLDDVTVFLRPLLAQFAKSFPAHQEAGLPTGHKWDFGKNGGVACEVTLKKTNVKQWIVDFIILKAD